MAKSYAETLASQIAAGSLLNTYTTAKRVINDDALCDLHRGFWKPGRTAKIEVRGAISNIVTTPGTIQFLVKMGTTASPVTVFDSGTVQLNATAHTTLPFSLDIDLRADKDNHGSGTTTKLMGLGTLTGLMFTLTAGQTDSAQGHQTILVPQTAPALGAGFDDSIVNTPDFWAGFSISNAGNGIRIDQYRFIDLGISS